MRPVCISILLAAALAIQSRTSHAQVSSVVIPAAEAAAHIDEEATVCGRVAQTTRVTGVSGVFPHTFRPATSAQRIRELQLRRIGHQEALFINLGQPYPAQEMSIVVLGPVNQSEIRRAVKYRGKDVCVTGMIDKYDGKPVMRIETLGAIEFFEATTVSHYKDE